MRKPAHGGKLRGWERWYLRSFAGGVMVGVAGGRFRAFGIFLAAVAGLAATAATIAAARSQGVPQSLIEQRILAQQGLSIGLAQITLQSQGLSFAGFIYPVGQCNELSFGGSLKVLSATFSPTKIAGRMQIFFDTACQRLYIDETVKFTPVQDHYKSSASYTLFSTTGVKLGTFALTGTLANIPTGNQITGTTTFTPHNNAPPATFAFSCQTLAASPAAGNAGVTPAVIPPDGGTDCAVGIVQNFPQIGMATASITPITLHFTLFSADSKVTFSQTSPAKLMTGALDALSIRINGQGKVIVDGPAVAYGRDKVSGEAAEFNLFPPKPTRWNVKDTGHSTEFAIALTSDRTRKLSGTISPTNSATPLATIEVDQSGTGRISYSDGTNAAISSWVVGN